MARPEIQTSPPERLRPRPARGDEQSSGAPKTPQTAVETDTFQPREAAPSFASVLLRALSVWAT
jgi:hypothetical protein